MKPSEIRTKEEKELLKMIDEKRGELFILKTELALGQLAKTANITKSRRDIARLRTILQEKARKVKTDEKRNKN